MSDGEDKMDNPFQGLRDEDDEIPNSQIETEPVLELSAQVEQQSTSDTFISQQSPDKEDTFEFPEDDAPKEGGSSINSSMEVEANDSDHNTSLTGTQQTSTKRKERNDDSFSPLQNKKRRSDAEPEPEAVEEGKSLEVVFERPAGVVNETIVLDDSEDFSLRIEDTTQPSQLSQETMKISSDSEGWRSHDKDKSVSPGQASLSQRSVNSWNSHDHHSWSSHCKDLEDKYSALKREYDEVKSELMCSRKAAVSPDSMSKEASVNGDVKGKVVEESLTAMAVVTFQCTVDDKTNKVIFGEIKQISLVEEPPGDVKTGRMSIMSSSSHKSIISTSSAGSVGLPGPFSLPGRTRASIMSTSTSSSSGARPGWDGPFLKPSLPVPGSRLPATLACGFCNKVYPPFDRAASPLRNGSPKLLEEEEMKLKQFTTRRSRKASVQSPSSGPIEEETSSSGSQPQASSTPTPNKSRARGRPKKCPEIKQQKTPKSVRTPTAAPSPPSTKQSTKGEAVLARWTDGRYYPGWVSEVPGTGPASQILVNFCDGNNKLTHTAKVVRADILVPGTLVLADTDDGEYEEALVVKVNRVGTEPVYQVERDSVTREVQFSRIALLESQVTDLTLTDAQRAAASLNFNDLSLENIVSGPRKRVVRSFTEMARGSSLSAKKKRRQATPEPSTSHGQTYGGPDEYYMDTDSSTHSTCSLDLRGKEMRPLDVECSPPEVDEESRVKLNHFRKNMTTKSKKKLDEPKNTVDIFGPIPEVGSQLFKDCLFLITYTSEVELNRDCNVATSEGNSESERFGPCVRKERLRTQIHSGGGKVYNSLSQVTKEELPNTYLITDKPCNTPLYLQCLVNNIPIYSTSLIIQCCVQKRPFKELIALRSTKKLSAGYSLSKRCLTNPRNTQPLRGKALLLALSGESSLGKFWESLIRKSGGTCETYHGGCLVENRFDVIVTDAFCESDLVAQACEQRVPLVSLTWLQQCIINGDFRSPTELAVYKFNYSNADSPEY